jgi:hypothetical protein
METKLCPKCELEKETLNFDKSSTSKDGLYHTCKDCRKEYRKQNKESIKNYYNNYYISNLESEVNRKKIYRENNKDIVKNSRKKAHLKRKNNDPLFKFTYKIRSCIYNCLLGKNINTNTKTYQILGCNTNEFKTHLQSQFEPWMNWNNRGLYNGHPNYGWDIDHIIPMSTAKTEEDVIKLNHYTNLRPRCSYLNRVEDNRKYKTNI